MALRFVPDIHRATHRIALYLEESADFNVNQPEAHVLAHLVSFGDSTVADIHEAFAHKRSTLTSILDRLAARGFITRHSSQSDRRTFVIKLTATGKKMATKVYEHLQAFEARVLKDVSKQDLGGFLKVLAIAEELPRKSHRARVEVDQRRKSDTRRESVPH
jgi:DNA-binding MarR family transcriptional regulator